MTQRRFNAWRVFFINNPKIWRLFERYAREAKAAGRNALSARVLSERIRWYCMVEVESSDGFKLNDHHTPYYSRLLMWVYPEFSDFFSTKDSNFDATKEDILAVYAEATALWAKAQA